VGLKVRVIFPLILVVFGVGQEVFVVDDLPAVVNADDQTIGIAFDIEDCKVTDGFGVTVDLTNFFQVLPLSLFDDGVPFFNGVTDIRVLGCVSSEVGDRDQVHKDMALLF
jgi:hypothetical protein